jgi:hypothetical protein
LLGLIVGLVDVGLAIFDLGDGLNDYDLELVHCGLGPIDRLKKGSGLSGDDSGLRSIEVARFRFDPFGGVDEFLSLQSGQ